jgi:hypothetical protein
MRNHFVGRNLLTSSRGIVLTPSSGIKKKDLQNVNLPKEFIDELAKISFHDSKKVKNNSGDGKSEYICLNI